MYIICISCFFIEASFININRINTYNTHPEKKSSGDNISGAPIRRNPTRGPCAHPTLLFLCHKNLSV